MEWRGDRNDDKLSQHELCRFSVAISLGAAAVLAGNADQTEVNVVPFCLSVGYHISGSVAASATNHHYPQPPADATIISSTMLSSAGAVLAQRADWHSRPSCAAGIRHESWSARATSTCGCPFKSPLGARSMGRGRCQQASATMSASGYKRGAVRYSGRRRRGRSRNKNS